MRHLDLFSGIGGFALGLSWAGGFETIGFAECDSYCQRVLLKHWPNVPIYDDVEAIDHDGPVDIITAGFPCQPFSSAGRRGGSDDNRYLWPETLAVIGRYKPAWFIGENVAGLASMGFPAGEPEMEGRSLTRFQDHDHYEALYTYTQRMCLDHICEDLEREGYEVIPFVIPACALGAPHRRDRVWILAYAESQRCGKTGATVAESAQRSSGAGDVGDAAKQGLSNRPSKALGQSGTESESQRPSGDAADTDSQRLQGQRADDSAQGRKNARGPAGLCGRTAQWDAEPDVGRVVAGLPHRVDRLRG